MSSRASEHVKSNDARLGLQIASRHLKPSKVIGIQCRFCMVFGREERSGTKRKARSAVKGWSAPFRYDNIEIHMRQQHAVHFERYERLDRKDKDAREEFFRYRKNYDSSTGTGCPPSRDITIKSHFPSLSPNTKPIIFTIAKKDIVDVIVGDMFLTLQMMLTIRLMMTMPMVVMVPTQHHLEVSESLTPQSVNVRKQPLQQKRERSDCSSELMITIWRRLSKIIPIQ
jgi:hypothetical protein